MTACSITGWGAMLKSPYWTRRADWAITALAGRTCGRALAGSFGECGGAERGGQPACRLAGSCACFPDALQPGMFWQLSAPAEQRAAEEFKGLDCVALARHRASRAVFDTVRQLGIPLRQTLAFPDHHLYCRPTCLWPGRFW